MYVCVCVCVSTQVGCDTMPIFLTDMNSNYSFSLNSCHTKVKKPNLPY